MATLKKRIISYYGQDQATHKVRINGIAAVLYWRGTNAEVSVSSLDNIPLNQLSQNDDPGNDVTTGRIELPMVRDSDGHPIPYNDTFHLALGGKKVVFVVIHTYLDANE